MEQGDACLSRVSGEFVSAMRERAYRAGRCAQELRQTRRVWLLALLFFAGFAPLESRLDSMAASMDLLLWRAAIIGVGLCLVALTALPAFARYRDLGACLALVVIAACYAQLLALRQGSTGALLLLVVGNYLFSPGRFALVCINGWVFALLPWLADVPGRAADGWLELGFLVPANLLGALVLARLNAMQRLSLLANEQLQQAALARRHAQAEVEALHRRARQLLHNTLPSSVAEQLQRSPQARLASDCPEATVLFADIVAFTRLAERLSAADLVALLSTLYSEFDEVALYHGLEKIKTVGDAYMAVGGVTGELAGHQHRAGAMALDLLAVCRAQARATNLPLQLRIGIHSGPLVAGVIGRQRLAFDCWGQTVNIASRLQAQAPPGRILVSAAVRSHCPGTYLFSPERRLELRGCGPVLASRLYACLGVEQALRQ